jgi:hypothetical protein
MTSIGPTLPIPDDELAAPRKAAVTWWDRIEPWIERAGERLNPILVKEARQALKSRQFAISFGLLLICGWGWSLVGVASMSPTIYYAPRGGAMLIGYYWVLAFPLLVIVPFSAYRSLASEREDGTYELLSVTTLSARQIVGGKLGSSLLQMLVYFSALSPCIAFTYMLGGIDILTIGMILFYTFLGSLLLSVGGLLVASATRAKHWHVVLSVLLIVALLIGFWTAAGSVSEMLMWGLAPPIDDPDYWIAHLCLLSFYATIVVLLFLAAAAQINFASENRSTALRVVMLVQQMVLSGWIMWYWISERQYEILLVYIGAAGAYWAVMGALMTGEVAQLSERVQRRLPQSLLGRMLFTWFNPGPGTGYLFAVTNLISVVALAVFTSEVARFTDLYGFARDDRVTWFGVLLCCYLIIYLGFGKLLLTATNRRLQPVGPLGSLIIQAILLLLGSVMPLVVQSLTTEWYSGSYTALHITNPFWTLAETADGNILTHTSQSPFGPIPVVPVNLLIIAAGTLLLNLFAMAGEVRYVRHETPARVQQDEAELHPPLHPEKPRRLSPWDEPAT